MHLYFVVCCSSCMKVFSAFPSSSPATGHLSLGLQLEPARSETHVERDSVRKGPLPLVARNSNLPSLGKSQIHLAYFLFRAFLSYMTYF